MRAPSYVMSAGTMHLSKAISLSGDRLMWGVACTPDEDVDGEFVDPMGLDTSYFDLQGRINWHHTKGAVGVIGEPVKHWRTPREFYIKARLYPGTKEHPIPEGDAAWALACNGAKLAWSVEGKVLERRPNDPRHVTKALLINMALTHNPVNPRTWAKVWQPGDGGDLAKGDVLASPGMSTPNAGALIPESLEGAPWRRHLTKALAGCGCLEKAGDSLRFAGGAEGALAHFAGCAGFGASLAKELAQRHAYLAHATAKHLL